MKKHISLFLAILICLSFISCDLNVPGDIDTESYVESVNESEAVLSEPEQTAVATESNGETDVAEKTETESNDIMHESDSPSESATETDSFTETQTETATQTERATETQTETATQTEQDTENTTEDVMDKVDFIVSVPEGKDPVILQLTDPQIIDPTQQRYEGRLPSSQADYWAKDKKDELCYDYIREIIGATNPDLIILTGDIVYGEFDDNGENLLEFISFMESFNIPWAPVFGNHDNESKMGADWQCAQLENAKNCLFKQRTLTGNGNYTVGIEQGGKLTRVFFMLDSNGCGAASTESTKNGHTKTTAGFGSDQISWYTNLAKSITRLSPETKLSMAFHMQIAAFKDAMSIYSVDGSYTNVFIDEAENRADGDFGFTGRGAKGAWDSDYKVWNSIKSLGFDSIFIGHEHTNSSSIMYEGIRLQYGMKCSVYDRTNYINSDGTVVSTYVSSTTPWIGSSLFSLDESGEIKNPYIYYCNELPSPAPDSSKEEIAVSGLGTSNFTTDGVISVTAGKHLGDSEASYKVVASSQGKLYVNSELLKNKSSFTFSVYVPASSAKLAGYGEFAIRVKPNSLEPEMDGSVGGYINFNSTSSHERLKIEIDTWQTFTVDISGFGESCTEFSFVIASGNTIYLKDMTIE